MNVKQFLPYAKEENVWILSARLSVNAHLVKRVMRTQTNALMLMNAYKGISAKMVNAQTQRMGISVHATEDLYQAKIGSPALVRIFILQVKKNNTWTFYPGKTKSNNTQKSINCSMKVNFYLSNVALNKENIPKNGCWATQHVLIDR